MSDLRRAAVTDLTIAVLGPSERGCNEAVFLRSFAADITLVSPGARDELSEAKRPNLRDAGVALRGHCTASALAGATVLEADGRPACFDGLFPAPGSAICSVLAAEVGAAVTAAACLRLHGDQRTDAPELYAAGDVILGLDRISHAMGAGGVAVTTIGIDLAQQTPLRR